MDLQISNYNKLCISLAEIQWSIYSIGTGRDLLTLQKSTNQKENATVVQKASSWKYNVYF